ncbi:hypothetical protein BH23PAT1_BH23PAT1_3080 [soil metagenome]
MAFLLHDNRKFIWKFSAENTAANQAQLETLARDIEAVYPHAEGTAYLCLLEELPHISAEAKPIHGFAGIKPELLHTETPEAAVCLGVHESVHAKLGETVTRQAIQDSAPGFHDYFQDVLIPEWVAGNISFSRNDSYLLSRMWDALYPGKWVGPHEVTLDGLQGALSNYFSVLARNEIVSIGDGDDWYSPSPAFRGWEDTLQKPVLRAEELEDKQWLAKLMLTGYQIGEELYSHYRGSVTEFPGVDMWEAEEGLANFIASGLTNVPLKKIQAIAKQDISKLASAQKFADTKFPADELAASITDYRSLYEFVRNNLLH